MISPSFHGILCLNDWLFIFNSELFHKGSVWYHELVGAVLASIGEDFPYLG